MRSDQLASKQSRTEQRARWSGLAVNIPANVNLEGERGKLAILHVCRNPQTGVWSLMKALALEQRRQGYDSHLGLILPRDWPYFEELAETSVPVFQIASPSIPGTAAYAYHLVQHSPVHNWIRAITHKHRYDRLIVHYHDAWLAGVWVAQHKSGISLDQVVTWHGLNPNSPLLRQPVRYAIHRLFARKLRRVACLHTAVDRATPPVAERLFGLRAEMFRIVQNGVSQPKAILSRSGNEINVGHVGVIDEGKGWRLTAGAVEQLRASGLPVRITIAGRGPDADAARRWCADHSTFSRFLGYVPDAATSVMSELDVFCLASRTEGLPMALLEAMAIGVVPIATPVGGIPDIIRDGIDGFLVERNVESIAAKILLLVGDRDRLMRMQKEALERIRSEYSIDVVCRSYTSVYRAAVLEGV